MTISNRLDMFNANEDQVKLQDTLKHETLKAAKKCTGERPKSQSGFTSVETLDSIEKNHAASLAGNHGQYRTLPHRTTALQRRDKERYVIGLAEEVECHLKADVL